MSTQRMEVATTNSANSASLLVFMGSYKRHRGDMLTDYPAASDKVLARTILKTALGKVAGDDAIGRHSSGI